MTDVFIQCSGCKESRINIEENYFFVMDCDCAIGSPFCNSCFHYFQLLRLPLGITCKWCSKSGLISIRPNFTFYDIFRFWKYLQTKTLFVRISSDWRVFSRYYRDDFLNLTSHNLQKIKMMYALHQLFFLSQMNHAVDSPITIQFICNPWENNPKSQFTLKILRINLARKLVCKLFATETGPSKTPYSLFTKKIKDFPTQEIKITESFNLFKQSYLQRSHNRFLSQKMMHRLLMYLMEHL